MSNRRLNVSSLLGVLAIVTLIASVSACIFDEGKYKGGGRLDTAGTAKQNNSSSSSSGGVLDDDDNNDDDDNTVVDSGSGSQIDTGAQ